MENKKYISTEKQAILIGSSKLKDDKKVFNRVKYFEENMQYNKSYVLFLEKNKISDKNKKILNDYINKYKEYRSDWSNPIKRKNLNIPLSIDIETAAICDLACPHCSREYIITPDKIMDEDLYKKIIDETSKLNIPSIKLNWRGEPLLNPKMPEMINTTKKLSIIFV